MTDPTGSDPWGSRELDLTAYLHRIGQPEREPSPAALAALHRAHRSTFPFENIDVLLGQHPGVSLAAVQAKFLGSRRGGYCFEHAVLLGAALDRLGYAARRFLSRVRDPITKARNHQVLVVDLDGERWLCDPGMGWTIIEPMPLADGAEVDQGGWRFRLRRHRNGRAAGTWEMQRWYHEQWESLHWIDEGTVHPVDVEVGHYWTSTHPTSHFRDSLMVSGFTRKGNRLGISLDGVTLRRPGLPTVHEELPTDAHEIGRQLSRVGIYPSDEELDRLTARVAELRGQ